MTDEGDSDTVTVTVNEDGFVSMTGVKRMAEDSEIEEDAKRLRIELAEDGEVVEAGQIIEEVSVQEADLDDSQLVQEAEEVALSEGVVIEEEVVHQQPAPQYQNLIIQHMDIAEPLSTLKQLLEMRLQCSLADHQFFLQDSIALDTQRSLVDQCVQGEGMVQINLEVKSQPAGVKPKINILDILKPAEEVESKSWQEQTVTQATPAPAQTPTKVVVPLSDKTENISRWVVDQAFRKEQERLKIPFDPFLWSEMHVQHWLQWAVKEFSLEDVDVENFKMTGKQLCEIEYPEFIQYIHNDKDDIVWTHLELLRKCKFVAVMQQPTPQAVTTITVSTTEMNGRKGWKHAKSRSPRISGDHGFSPGNRTGNNGQIQLWQFLLELLTDKDCREVIHWLGEDGEFKLNNPEMVAQLWGQRKNKPTMNYEKLSRALRYYYDGDMIAKVHGKRFVYKFVCDLKMLLGYSAGELNRQVTMCAEKKLQRVRETLRPTTAKQRLVEATKMVTHTVQTMD